MTGLTSTSAKAGFTVGGNQLFDANGNVFIMRGVNHAHTWYTGRTQQALADIASVGANTVRVVLSNGERWTRNDISDVANVIQQLKTNRLIAVLRSIVAWVVALAVGDGYHLKTGISSQP